MKILFFLFFILTSCSSNSVKINNLNFKETIKSKFQIIDKSFELVKFSKKNSAIKTINFEKDYTFDEFGLMLDKYNIITDYPIIN